MSRRGKRSFHETKKMKGIGRKKIEVKRMDFDELLEKKVREARDVQKEMTPFMEGELRENIRKQLLERYKLV